MQSQYDAVVAGAGPAGSMAAFEIASAGFSVLLLEKHERPGLPLCCAEAVSRGALSFLPDLKEEWISTRIERARLVGPDQSQIIVERKQAGYILNRPRFDLDLAERAQEAGADLICNAIGRDLHRRDTLFNTIDVITADGAVERIGADIFIAADGVESQLARQAGMPNILKRTDVLSAVQYRVENLDINDDLVCFHIGCEVAPGGYVWVFPKSRGTANIGIGVVGNDIRGGDAERLLDRFIATRYPHGAITARFCGLVPTFQGRRMFRRHNVLTAGDAARAIDSFSGAGIGHALSTGKHAGLAAVAYLSGQVKNVDDLDSLYPQKYFNERLEELKLYARLRHAYLHFDDSDFTEIVHGLQEYFSEHSADTIHVGRLLVHLIKARPRLLRFIRYVL